MSSSPPGARDSSAPPPLARVAEAELRAHGADEAVIFFCVDGAPREACRTHALAGGGLLFETILGGRVLASEPGELQMEHAGRPVVVRHLVPSALDLGGLAGHAVQVRVAQQYVGAGRATIDAEIRDASGRLLLWAHDGRMPPDRSAHGLALRCTVAESRQRLAVGHAGGVVSIGAPELAEVRAGGDLYALAVVRVETDDVAFVLLRR